MTLSSKKYNQSFDTNYCSNKGTVKEEVKDVREVKEENVKKNKKTKKQIETRWAGINKNERRQKAMQQK